MFHWSQGEKSKNGPQNRKNSRYRKVAQGRTRNCSVGFESLENRQLLTCSPMSLLGLGLGGIPALTAAPTISPTPTSTTQAATQTALVASNLTPSYGQNVTLTATVTTGSGAVTGLVQFSDGTTVIGTASLRNGVAQIQVGNLAPGASHSLTAQYMGSDSYAASVSPTAINATVTVSQTPTITLLSASSNPVATGQPLTLLAQVLPNYTTGPVSAAANTSRLSGFLGGLFGRGGFGGQSNGLAPTGTVAFQYTTGTGTTAVTTTLGTALLNNGQAELTLAAATLAGLPADASISAAYSGDTNYATSDSQTISESNGTSVSSARVFVQAARTVTEGAAATLSITVKPAKSATAAIASTDTVTLYDATTGLLLTPSSGSATTNTNPVPLTVGTSTATGSFSTTFTTPGLHLIIATFSGDSNYASEEAIISVYVQSSGTGSGQGGFEGGAFGAPVTGLPSHSTSTTSATQAATTTALAVSNATPDYGQQCALTATVSTSSGTPTGLVQFSNGSTVVGTASLRNGVATLQIGNLAAGSYSLTAQYMGNANYLASSPSSSVAVTIGQTRTTTLLLSSPSPVDPTGQALALIAQVSPNYNSATGSGTTAASRMESLLGGLFGWGGPGGLRGPGGQLSNGQAPSGTVTFQYTTSAANHN